jgi:hypothetical protein
VVLARFSNAFFYPQYQVLHAPSKSSYEKCYIDARLSGSTDCASVPFKGSLEACHSSSRILVSVCALENLFFLSIPTEDTDHIVLPVQVTAACSLSRCSF